MARANRDATPRWRTLKHSEACSARVPVGPGAVRAENRTPRKGWSSGGGSGATLFSAAIGSASARSGVTLRGKSTLAYCSSLMGDS
eukprot:9303837-Karenia_brevis.AAC.1